MMNSRRRWLLIELIVLAILLDATVTARSSHSSFASTLNSTLVGHSWQLQDINGPDCGPPLGLSDAERTKGIVKRIVSFRRGGVLNQHDIISPSNGKTNAIEAKYAINGDHLNIRWHPEDENVDSYRITGLSDAGVTLANGSTCRYKRLH